MKEERKNMPSYLYDKDEKLLFPTRTLFSDIGVSYRDDKVMTNFLKPLPSDWIQLFELCYSQHTKFDKRTKTFVYSKSSKFGCLPVFMMNYLYYARSFEIIVEKRGLDSVLGRT